MSQYFLPTCPELTSPLCHILACCDGERHLPGSNYWWKNVDRHPAGAVFIQHTLAGSVCFKNAKGAVEVPAGCAFITAYGEETEYGLTAEQREPYRCEWIILYGAGIRELAHLIWETHGHVFLMPKESLRAARNLLRLGTPNSVNDSYDRANLIYAFIVSLHGNLSKQRRQGQSPVEQAIAELVQRPAHNWSLKELVDDFGISREHFSRQFQKRLGVSPMAWLNAARTKMALQLLQQTDLSLAAIARQTGFSSYNHLARHLRATTGTSARDIRKAANSRK
jgi:AraC family transcriptional regulator